MRWDLARFLAAGLHAGDGSLASAVPSTSQAPVQAVIAVRPSPTADSTTALFLMQTAEVEAPAAAAASKGGKVAEIYIGFGKDEIEARKAGEKGRFIVDDPSKYPGRDNDFVGGWAGGEKGLKDFVAVRAYVHVASMCCRAGCPGDCPLGAALPLKLHGRCCRRTSASWPSTALPPRWRPSLRARPSPSPTETTPSMWARAA